jgi:hypothetical protein
MIFLPKFKRIMINFLQVNVYLPNFRLGIFIIILWKFDINVNTNEIKAYTEKKIK